MSMKGVDFQVALPKAAELARTVQAQNKESETVQAHLVTRMGQEVAAKNRKVTSLRPADHHRVEPERTDDEGQAGYRGDDEECAEDETAPSGASGKDPKAAPATPPGPGERGQKLDIVV